MSSLARGRHTLTVSMQMFKENRRRLVESLTTANAWTNGNAVVLEGGKALNRYSTDTNPNPFRQVRAVARLRLFMLLCIGIELLLGIWRRRSRLLRMYSARWSFTVVYG
jgi:hypothetical protein